MTATALTSGSAAIWRHGTGLRLVERRYDFAIGAQPLVDLEAVAALGQRLRLHPTHVVVELAVAALDEEHIAVPLGRNVGNCGTGTLQQRIGGDSGAETNIGDVGLLSELLQSCHDAIDRVFRRGQ
jgi:hypothetical protein